MRFPIVLSTDKNYVVPTYVAIHSLVRHTDKDTLDNIDIYILCSGVDTESRDYFNNLGVNIKFVDVEMEKLNLNRELDYISMATYYRLMIPDILVDYDRCLYLDSDLIVRDDITNLLLHPIKDYTIMGVKNYFSQEVFHEFYEQRCKECSIDTLDTYVNAGVLLVNLDRVRVTDTYSKMLDDLRINHYAYNDQDIINKYCYGRIGLMSVKYNFMVSYLKRIEKISEVLNESVLDVAHDPVIVHYASRKKPWRHRGYLMTDLWIDEVRNIKDTEALNKLVKPFIKESRRTLSFKEWIADEIKYIFRRCIQRSFIHTHQIVP